MKFSTAAAFLLTVPSVNAFAPTTVAFRASTSLFSTATEEKVGFIELRNAFERCRRRVFCWISMEIPGPLPDLNADFFSTACTSFSMSRFTPRCRFVVALFCCSRWRHLITLIAVHCTSTYLSFLISNFSIWMDVDVRQASCHRQARCRNRRRTTWLIESCQEGRICHPRGKHCWYQLHQLMHGSRC